MGKIMYVLLLLLPMTIYGLIEEDAMPRLLQDCYTTHALDQSNCLDEYLVHTYKNTTRYSIDQNALDWLDSLGRKLHIRIKRQSTRHGGRYRRTRKEIRTLSERERENFFYAVNALKKDRSKKPNKYDVFALMHQDIAIPSAHGGYNFVGWHRYYLVLFEEALRTKKSSVTLPYWDSTLDFNMKKPELSILFSEIFIGNGRGIVYTGPFALWRTPAQNTYLRRDIPGPDSSLIDPTKLLNVFKKRYHRDILNPTAKKDNDNLENHHDGVHRWVGGRDGHMGGLDTSPQDPVFWLHHSYIDYLWEKFRERQKRLGINSEKDYPPTTDPFHKPNRVMDNLKPEKTNIEGYSNSFTKYIYQYAPAPTCANRCGRSYNSFLYCYKNRCVSRSRSQFIYYGGFKKVRYWYRARIGKQLISTALKVRGSSATLSFAPDTSRALRTAAAPSMSRKFRSSITDPRTRSRKRRSLEIMKVGFDINLILQNNGNESRWSFVPNHYSNWAATSIMIINEHQIHSRKALSYDENTSIDNYNSIRKHHVESPTFNITLQTDGFTYHGRHTDNVIIDKRTLSSVTMAYIAFEKPPVSSESKAYVTIQDSYGNPCRPSCLVSGLAKSSYRDCSGVIKITNDLPLMYMDSSNFDSEAEIKPFLRFHCNN